MSNLRIWWTAIRDAHREAGAFWALIVALLAPFVMAAFEDLKNAVDC